MYKEFPVTGSKMIELQRGMNFLCELSSVTCLSSELLRYQDIQEFC